jgi:O-antigen/teichoic acid export membrane protein
LAKSGLAKSSTAKEEVSLRTSVAAIASGSGPAPRRGGFVQNLARWLSKGGLAILDQGLISGSNFIISILLARWLMPDAYGAYAVAFGIWIMLSLVYQSLVLEPMGVFGGSTFHENLRGYLRSLLSIHVALSIVICAALGVWWQVAHWQGASSATTGALAGLVFASPCLMLFYLARRTFYVELSPAPAAAGAFIYSAVVLAGLYLVYRRSALSTLTAFLLIGAGALVTGIVLMIALRRGLSGRGPAPTVKEVWNKHWRYGAWALVSCIAGWLPSYIYFPLLASFASMEQSGQLKALMNLVQPFEQTRGALLMLALPYAARVMSQHGRDGARLLARNLTLLSGGGALLYWAIIIPLHVPVFHLLYKGRYLDVAYLLPALALGQIFWSATFGPSIALRAMESPSSVFWALLTATAASLMVGVPLTHAFGLKGAIWGSNAADFFSLAALFVVFGRKLASQRMAKMPMSGAGANGDVRRPMKIETTLGTAEES